MNDLHVHALFAPPFYLKTTRSTFPPFSETLLPNLLPGSKHLLTAAGSNRERSVTLVLGFFYESEQVCLSHGHDCGKGFVRGLVPGYGIIWPGKLRDSPQRITPLTPVLFIEDNCKDFQEINVRVILIPHYNAYKNHVWIMLYCHRLGCSFQYVIPKAIGINLGWFFESDGLLAQWR